LKAKTPQPKEKSHKKAVRGVRYDSSQKKEILKFIEDYNQNNGRGGQSAAAAQYGVSVLTLINWQKGSSVSKPKKKKAAKKKKRSVSKKRGRAKSTKTATIGFAGRIQAILSQISSNEKAIAKLTDSTKVLKQKLKKSISE